MDLGGEPLPLLWTCDYIPKNPDDWPKGPYDRSCPDETTEYTVGEFNCSCVGISKFQAVCGGEQTLADVSDEDYFDACELTDLMGVKALEMLQKAYLKRTRMSRRLARLPFAVLAGKYSGETDGAGKRAGQGKCKYADGAVYEGTFAADVATFPGSFKFADGVVFELALMKQQTRSGKGTFRWKSGAAEITAFASDAPVGEGAGWSADGKEAWRLLDGQRQEGALELADAEAVAKRLGLAVPNLVAPEGEGEEGADE